jgi:3-methyladenine DNA glycosylase AlkC
MPADDAFALGLELLAALTPRLTSEFSLRPFLAADLERTLATAMGWTGDPDQHVRRLASEGTRPGLPWAARVPALLDRPTATLPILDALYRDPCERVRRSVANHLNDLSKAEPALAVEVAERWLAAPDDQTERVVRHGLRTLVKRGDPRALALQGFAPPDDLVVDGPRLDAEVVRVGDALTFSLAVTNAGAAPAKVETDYVVHFRRADGTTAPKVFKVATRTLEPGETAAFTRARSFRPITTRTHHLGEHALEAQVNGRRSGRVTFRLVAGG